MFAFSKSYSCAQRDRELGPFCQRRAGKTEGDFQTWNHKKGEGSQTGRTSEARQGGFLGYCEQGPQGRGVSLAPEAPRIMFTVVGIKSNNDNNIDNKGHSRGP